MKKLYFLLAIMLTFSSATINVMAEDGLPPVEYGTDPFNYDYGKLRGDDPYAQQPQYHAPSNDPLVTQTPLQESEIKPEVNSDQQRMQAKYKFALLVPLSGKGADIGKALRDAADMAIAEKGSAEYSIIPIDVNANGAEAAAEQAVSSGAQVILGPIFSDEVGKVAKVARQNKLKVISFSNNKMVAGNGVYIYGLIPSQQVERMLLFSSNKGLKNYSAIVPNNTYGHSVAEMVTKFAGWIGGVLYEIGLYSAKTSTSAAANTIADGYAKKGAKPSQKNDGIIIAEGGEKLKSVAAAISSAGIGCSRVRCLGVASWDDKNVIGTPALNGAWYAASPYEDVEDFLIRFQQKYRYLPDEISSLGYDAAVLAIEVAPNFNNATLERKEGFKGIKGIYRFTHDGINQRGYAVYEISNGTAQVLEGAPNRF